MVLRLLLRALRASCLAAPPIGRRIPLCSPAPPAAGRGTASCRAFRERGLLLAEPQRLAMEGEAGEEESPVLPATSGQIDGKQIVGRKKKQRKKQRKKSDCLDDSFDCLIMEMPFAEVDIEEEFSPTSSIKAKNKKKRKRTTGRENDEDDLIKKKKKDQDRPNYFISVPITNSKISDGIHALQDTIIEKDGRLSKAMIHYGSFHVTLLVMHLSTEAAIDNAVSAFLKSQGLIEELLQGKPLDLSFQGTDHFRNQVGFVKLSESDNTTTLLKIAGVYRMPCSCGQVYIGTTKRSAQTRIKEHERHCRLIQPEKSAIAEHLMNQPGHRILFENTKLLDHSNNYHVRLHREAIEIHKHVDNFNRKEETMKMNKIWLPVLQNSKIKTVDGNQHSEQRMPPGKRQNISNANWGD
ncbi:A-kinase anchoring protein 7 isoform X3 [Anolis carolinensis]|uniref:A-kinase anchoring protein 7 isoform X3 n=1 Tax=Anolis carolinensis TaxID=28377 RepID=UPI002F2B5DF6